MLRAQDLRWPVAFTVVVIGLSLGASMSGHSQAKRTEGAIAMRNSPQVLVGTPRIHPLVEFPTSLSIAGLAPESVESEVKKQLREAGVKVIDASDLSVPDLQVNLLDRGLDSAGRSIITLELQMTEAVQLIRAPKTRVYGAATMIKRKYVSIPHGKAAELRSAVHDLVAEFCANYKKSNPKK